MKEQRSGSAQSRHQGLEHLVMLIKMALTLFLIVLICAGVDAAIYRWVKDVQLQLVLEALRYVLGLIVFWRIFTLNGRALYPEIFRK
jgi:hypothetical protein